MPETAPLSPERLAEIEACASPHLAAMLAEERPDSAIMHRIELLAEVKRLTEQVAGLQRELDHAVGLLKSIPFFRSDEEQDALCEQGELALADEDARRADAMQWRDAEPLDAIERGQQ